MAIQFPKGKYISMVKVGEKGQIVIPKGARDLFSIQPGDNLLLLADEEKGHCARSVGIARYARGAVCIGKGSEPQWRKF